MKRWLGLSLALLMVLYGCKSFQQEEISIKKGRVEEITVNADPLLGILNTKVLVYLPPDYDATKKYPVIYMLHGFGGDYGTYVYYNGVNEILDYLISTGQIDPVVVVMPDGRNAVGGSFYTNSRAYDPNSLTYLPVSVFGDYETYIIDSLIPQIERRYSVYKTREKRAIMGISMGSYGSAKLWLKHADMFGVVALHSGPLSFDRLIYDAAIDSFLNDLNSIGNKLWIKDYLGREHGWLTLGNGLAAAFTPRVVPYANPADWRVMQNCFYSPGGLDSLNGDFLLDTVYIPSFGIKVCVGVRIPIRKTPGPYASCLSPEQQSKPNADLMTEDFCVWKKYHDPYTLIDSAKVNFPTEFVKTKVYIDVGLKDELTLLSHNRWFKDKLKTNGISDLVYVEFDGALGYPADMFPGMHSNWFYARLKKSFLFINRAFKGEDVKAGEYKEYQGKDYE